ncbi:hypothetical protein Gpo141_00008274 [Globisporangium polare]
MAAALLAYQLTAFKRHFDTHAEKYRILRSLQELSSLRLHLTIKRDSMYVFGASQFDVFATPVTTTDGVSYGGIATFEDASTVHKYMLADNIAYHVTETSQNGSMTTQDVACLAPSDVPPVHELLDAINAAKPVDSVISTDGVTCATGQPFKLVFSGDDYILCTTLASGKPGFKIFGSDLDIEFSFLSTPAVITKPEMSAEASTACEKVPSTSSVTIAPSTMELLSNAAKDLSSRALRAQEAQVTMAPSGCGCKSTERVCIFIPGRGSDRDNGLQDSNSDYFGMIQKHAPCCSSVKFALINTDAFGWNDAALQQRTCDLALQVSNSSNLATRTIEDTIVVAHSMGNMILGGAIANGKCQLGTSSSWVALSASMKDSMGANFLQNVCNGKLSDVVTTVAELIGECPANNATQALSYQGDAVYTSSALNAQYTAAQSAYSKHVTAAMCSSDFQGLLSIDKLKYGLGGTVTPHKSKENDGIVEYQSCAAGLSTVRFGESYTNQFYAREMVRVPLVR